MSLQDRLNKIMAQKRGFTDVVLEENSCILNDLRNEIINDNTIVVIESHKKHAEVYPSIIHYFLELGFNVHLYCLKEHLKENSLCRVQFDSSKFKIFAFPIMPESDEFFEHLTKYKYIFIDTIFTHDGYNFINALDKGYSQKYNKDNVYCIDHDFVSVQKGIETIEQRMIANNKTFVLRDKIEILGKKLPFVVPSWFGNYSIPQKNDKTHFISVGGGYQNNLRNFRLLFNSIDKLIDNGEVNFDVTFIGATKEMLKDLITSKNEKFLNILGFTDFFTLYNSVEQSHFLLYNIDDTCNEYEKYLNTGVSGSYALGLGFSKPAIIFEQMVDVYGLRNVSLTYGKDLYSTMQKAICMNNNDYQKICSDLAILNKNLMTQSFNNMNGVFK